MKQLHPTFRLLIATNNAGKFREYETLLAGLPLILVSPAQAGIDIEVDENGASFEANAIIKARAYGDASSLPTLADDSGLEVDHLAGAPGIHSARYAGPGATDRERYQKLLRALEGMPTAERTARFRCVIALALPGGDVTTAAGACEGVIGTEPLGEGGFGYDPVFLMPGLQLTMAELPAALKDRVSHRARAAMKMKPILWELICESQQFATR